MAQRLPLDLIAEYRGSKPAGQFTRKDTGEVVDTPARLKFEIPVGDDGDVELLEVAASQFDKCVTTIDHAKLSRGDVVRLRGFAMIMPRGSDKDSYVTFDRAEAADEHKANGRARPAAVAA